MDSLYNAMFDYAARHSGPEPALLQEVAAYTRAHHPKHHMLSGHLQGRFLSLLSRLLRPRRILEIGTFTGYSALCLAEGLAEGGELHTIELRADDAATARGFFDRSPLGEQIFLHIGEAGTLIGELDGNWDMVFIDADKVSYLRYFERILPAVRAGGLILADNTLFHGTVLEPEIRGKNALAIQAFNDAVRESVEVEGVLLPLRDGLTLLRKC